MRLPTSREAKRMADIMHRRHTTSWNPREIKEFRKRVEEGCFTEAADLTNLERYYARHWPPNRDKNILRHDLLTLLRYLQGEVDRATAWAELHPIKSTPRKIIPITLPSEPYTQPARTAEEQAQHDRFMAEYEARKAK